MKMVCFKDKDNKNERQYNEVLSEFEAQSKSNEDIFITKEDDKFYIYLKNIGYKYNYQSIRKMFINRLEQTDVEFRFVSHIPTK